MADQGGPLAPGGSTARHKIEAPTMVHVRARVWPVHAKGGWKSIAPDSFWQGISARGLLDDNQLMEAQDAMDAADAGQAQLFVDHRHRYYQQLDSHRPRWSQAISIAMTQLARRAVLRGLPRLLDVEGPTKSATSSIEAVGSLRALFPTVSWMSVFYDYVLPQAPRTWTRLRIWMLLREAFRGSRVLYWDSHTRVFTGRKGPLRHSPKLTHYLQSVPCSILDPLQKEESE